eukprot:2666757-Rhodomonas_salina.1
MSGRWDVDGSDDPHAPRPQHEAHAQTEVSRVTCRDVRSRECNVWSRGMRIRFVRSGRGSEAMGYAAKSTAFSVLFVPGTLLLGLISAAERLFLAAPARCAGAAS